MKALFRLDAVSIEKRDELLKEYFDIRIKNQIDDVKKLSVTHLVYGFETFLRDKYDLPIIVSAMEFLTEANHLMMDLGYEYQGHTRKLRFNDITKEKLEYDRVARALRIDHLTITIDAHRYFKLAK